MKNVAAGANPMLLKRGILAGTEALVKAIDEQSLEVTTREEISN
jgi:chaperonin GroEL